MENTTHTVRAVTQQYDFHNATPNGEKLFSVRGGIPLSDAFNELSLYLSAVQSVIDTVATSGGQDACANWAASHLMEFTYALVQSMHDGLTEHEKATVNTGGEA